MTEKQHGENGDLILVKGYALLRTANPDKVAEQLRGYGGTILSTTLSRDQQKKLEDVLSKKAA